MINPIWVAMMKKQREKWERQKAEFERTGKKPSYLEVMKNRALRPEMPARIPLIGIELEGFFTISGEDPEVQEK